MRAKWIHLVLVATMALALASAGAVAQVEEQAQEMSLERFIELVRTDIKKQRVQLITQAMQFSGEESAQFWPIYQGYEAEFTKLGDARLELIRDYAEHYESMTDEKAGELARQVIALEERRTALKKQCFEKIEQEMSSVVAARFLQAENQINMLLDLQLASQLPLIQ